MDVHQVVGALKYLEGRWGATPSTKDIAEEAGCSEATALKYLGDAVDQKLIVKRGRRGQKKYMSLEVARAFDEQKEKQTKGKG